MIASQIFGLLAVVALLCAVQSGLWGIRRLPTLRLDANVLTVFLTGWTPIRLEDRDIKRVTFYSVPDCPFCIAIVPASPNELLRRLTLLDRFYFRQSQRLAGFGFSYQVVLPPDEQAELVRILGARFGGSEEIVSLPQD